ncbi:MAG: S8 family serine peptidase [Chloroflexi bacterium]|nr:S8 family serine peptidase [Chloroflexota bacterium]
MRQYKFLFVVIFLLLTTLIISGLTTSAAQTTNSAVHIVQISDSAFADFEQLKLKPGLSLDYDSFHWLELNEADFAALSASDVPFTAVPHAGQIQIVNHTFDPVTDGEPILTAAMQANGQKLGFHLVQFIGPIRGEWLTALETAGLPMLQYYPHNTYLTWGTAVQLDAIESFSFIRWQGAVHPAYKIDNNLQGENGRIQNVDIFFYNDGDLKSTLSSIQALGATILQDYPAQPDQQFYDAVVQIDAAVLPQLAQINTILWMGHLGPEPILDDEMSSQIVAGNHPGGVPVTGYNAHLNNLGVDGTGVTWAVIDTGVDYAHPDLNGHIGGGYSFPGACNTNPGDDCANGGHGTHVAGIVGGDATAGFTDANGFLYGLGIAPNYSIFAMNSLSAPSWPPVGGWQEHSKRAVLGGAIGGNNSWTTGEGTQHGYQSSERTHDIMVRDGNFDTTTVAEPFIEVFSAGNSGSSGLTAPKEGKNLIVTAASVNYRAGSIDSIASFSSRGPAVDGRWVPTITAPGEQIASSHRLASASQCTSVIAGTNNHYSWCSGTSMAAPQTSGAIVLFTEWWRGFNGSADPSPAMSKALLVNGAVDMGTADIPNINEGWGRINITNVISPNVLVEYRDQIDIFNNSGEQVVFSMGVPDPTKPVKVTIAWSDAPGAAGANPALVNNLDLTVANGGNTYLGNVFSGGWSAIGGNADALNNLENVYIQNPASDLTITVDATNIAGDGIPYNADTTDQDFVLVCQNCSFGSDFSLTAIPNTQNICAPTPAFYTVDVGSVLGFTDPVTLNSVGEPVNTIVSFSTNPVTPPGMSTLLISDTQAATGGHYDIAIVGVAPTSTHTTTVGLDLATAVPIPPILTSPANGASNIPTLPTFTWNASPEGVSYLLEVASDVNFNTVVYSNTIGTTNDTIPSGSELNTSTAYYWRVTATNGCGTGSASPVFTFITVPAPGDCNIGDTRNEWLNEDFESGGAGWTHSGTGDTWALSTAKPHSGNSSYHAANVSSISDQYLVSPPVVLPTGESPMTLQFWNDQTIEDRSSGCFDGAVLEISVNGGGTWTRLENELLTDPYDGPVSSSYGNPLGGENAWCGDPQSYLNSIVDIDAFAGQTAQFRFRLATDSSISREGWYVDDVVVQSCQAGSYGVDLDAPTTAATGPPTTAVTYTVNITNTGGLTDSFDINVTGNSWPSVASSNLITLTPGSNSSFAVVVTVPTGALAGDMDAALVMAVSQGSPSVFDDVTLTTTAAAVYDVDMQAPNPAQSGQPGNTLTYTVWVSNTGNINDTFDITAVGSWAVSPVSQTVSLAAGSGTAVNVNVDILANALAGDMDVTTVTAVSQNDANATANVMLTSTAAAVYGVDLQASNPAQSGQPGSMLTYAIWISNTGNITETVALTATSSWPANLASSQITLPPGGTTQTSVTVTVPANANNGDSDMVQLTAASAYVSATVDLQATAVITTPTLYTLYLPVIMNTASPPDLIVSFVDISINDVQLLVTNQGGTAVTEAFWVDVYINPDEAPTAVNQTWVTQGGEGLAWGVENITLAPGDMLTLTLNSAYFRPDKSNFSGTIPAGSDVYAQVDSANLNTTYGAVLENHEINGGLYNNITQYGAVP